MSHCLIDNAVNHRMHTSCLEYCTLDCSQCSYQSYCPIAYQTVSNSLQSRREYQRPLWIAYVDLKAAFDSVDRSALWLLLRSLGLPEKIVGLMKEHYTDIAASVWKELFPTGSRSEVESDKVARLHHHSSCLLCIGSLNAQNIKAF